MAAENQPLIDSTIRHALHLEGLKAGEVKKFVPFLKKMNESITSRLAGNDLTQFSRTRLNKLLSVVNADLKGIYGDYTDMLGGDLEDLAKYEAGFEARNIANASAVNISLAVPTPNQLRAAIKTQPLSIRGPDGGKLLNPFINDWTTSERGKVIGAIRQGAFEGTPTDQILRNLRGTKTQKGILQKALINDEAIVRTSMQHVANTAKMETWKANDDLIERYTWSSTLDSKTSQQCRSLDNMTFDINGGPLPPAHIRCRSAVVPELGEEFEYLKEGRTRSARDPETGGVYSHQSNENYYDWLKRQDNVFQDDILGKKMGQVFRKGGLSSERFQRMGIGRDHMPLTMKQMRAKEPLAFDKAFDKKGNTVLPKKTPKAAPKSTAHKPGPKPSNLSYHDYKDLPDRESVISFIEDNVAENVNIVGGASVEGLNQVAAMAQQINQRFSMKKMRYMGHPKKDIYNYGYWKPSWNAAFSMSVDSFLFKRALADVATYTAREIRHFAHYANPDRVKRSLEFLISTNKSAEVIAVAKKIKKYDWSFSSAPMHTTTHEMGHRLHGVYFKELDPILLAADRDGWGKVLTEYSYTNHKELMAESLNCYINFPEERFRIYPPLLNWLKANDLEGGK